MSAAMPDFSNTRLANIFTTPLVTHTWEDGPEINALLQERILAHEAQNGGVAKSNHGGWHSETGRLEFWGEAGRRLVDHMTALADEATRRILGEHYKATAPAPWTLSAWGNVNRTGDFNSVHVHPGSTWSGTYYVNVGDPADPDKGTQLHLIDPCQGRSTTFFAGGEISLPSSVFIRPKPGLMVLFPSYVPNLVFPLKGNGARISIAFNLRKEPYP